MVKESPIGTDVDAQSARKAKRQQRLGVLLGRRTAESTPVAAQPGSIARAKGMLTGPDAAANRKALARVYRVLTDTPADDTGTVPGTPFTQTGVARLGDTLRRRAANEGAPGARVAAGLLKLLSSKDDEAEQVHGISVEKLQRIAKTAGNLKSKGFIRA